MKAVLRTLLAAVSLGVFLLAHARAEEAPSAETELGPVKGKLSADGKVKIFLGIPFAAPPVGRSAGWLFRDART